MNAPENFSLCKTINRLATKKICFGRVNGEEVKYVLARAESFWDRNPVSWHFGSFLGRSRVAGYVLAPKARRQFIVQATQKLKTN